MSKMLKELANMLSDLEKTEVKTTPNFKVLVALKNELHEAGYDHLIRHLGKMKIDVNNEFWFEHDLATRIIHSYANLIIKISKQVDKEFGAVNGNSIMSDMLQGMSIKHNG